MPGADPRIRKITIKTGVVKRLFKEKNMYEKEAKELEEKVERMRYNSADEYDIKKQIEVKNESIAMIPDCKKRLKSAFQDLTDLLAAEKDLADTTEYKAAEEALKDASGALP